jgi:hypothetical protein
MPSLLLSFGKRGTTKAFNEPVLPILGEEETEVSLEELEGEKPKEVRTEDKPNP